jgi:hypothetical protein
MSPIAAVTPAATVRLIPEIDRGLSDLPVEHAQVFAEPIKFAEVTLDRHQLVLGQGLAA